MSSSTFCRKSNELYGPSEAAPLRLVPPSLGAVPLEATLGTSLVGHRDRTDGTADRTHERKDQPPEVAREFKDRCHNASMPPLGLGHGNRDKVGDRFRIAEHAEVIPVPAGDPPAQPLRLVRGAVERCPEADERTPDGRRD